MPENRRFIREAKAVVADSLRLAAGAGATAVEPRHLLVALARRPDTAAGRALAAAGLDPAAIEDAAARDDRALLAAVGVHVDEGAGRGGAGRSRPRVSPATKRALELSFRVADERGDRRIGAEHVLLGVLRLDGGRVPQILEAAGTTPDDLAARL